MTKAEVCRELEDRLIEYDGYLQAMVSVNVLKSALEMLRKDSWTPVSERLPEEDGYYIVTTSSGGIDMDSFEKRLVPSGRPWFRNHDDVLAWRRLPEAWGGK